LGKKAIHATSGESLQRHNLREGKLPCTNMFPKRREEVEGKEEVGGKKRRKKEKTRREEGGRKAGKLSLYK
jgi:hypothetical protein